ncbi:PspC domain-containing protein [Bhargavaea ullalensis]|uniref:Phage shock protein PspC (Stress-responsive transcriptional regulator) n=1 Tax=Bhargavaea ullalensis TaxID=1265685 RepID=A0ABV2G8T6_9BACL
MTRITRSTEDRALFGICGGIAGHFGISSFLVRLVFLLTPASPLIYLILGMLIPEKHTSLYERN